MSSGLSPKSSSALNTSAVFTKVPSVEAATVAVISTDVLPPAAIGPATVIVAVLPAPAVQFPSFNVKPVGR